MNAPEAAFATQLAKQDNSLPREVDVAIIGGGLMGCASAYYLSKAGAKVLVLDKSTIAGQQSSRAWGFVRQQSRDEAEVPLMQASIRIWRTLEHELQTDLGWRNDGCLFVAGNEAERAGYESWLPVARSFSVDTVMLSPREVANRLPGYAVPQLGGLFTASDGQAEPTLVARAFAMRARELGAHIVEQCGAQRIDVAAGQVVGVETEPWCVPRASPHSGCSSCSALPCRSNWCEERWRGPRPVPR
jgi:glycine/D-amino acid oxidase-like deaminating enzyme